MWDWDVTPGVDLVFDVEQKQAKLISQYGLRRQKISQSERSIWEQIARLINTDLQIKVCLNGPL